MPIPPKYLIAGLAWLALLIALDRAVGARRRVAFRCAAGAVTLPIALAALQRLVFGGTVWMDVAKVAIAGAACAYVAYERHRARAGQPVARGRKRAAGVALAFAAVAAYFSGAAYGYREFFHVWDQYHYFVGGKYFRELGYDGLYRCAAVAQDELGRVTVPGPLTGLPTRIDLAAEVRRPGRLIRNLGADNELISVSAALANPRECRDRFSTERWEAFKADVAFFRLAAGPDTWEQMQRDHGYNPPPGWGIAGGLLASLRPASTGWQQALAMIDVAYLLATFAALGWAFGWRVMAVGAVWWGTQAFSPFYWTGGGFLRQDWLFWTVFAACLARKRYPALAGASLAYAAMLRVFPALLAMGWGVMAVAHLARTGRMADEHRRALAGGLIALALLVPLGVLAAGRADAYPAFYRHTVRVHAATPITNNMGLPVVLSHGVGSGLESGRLRYLRDDAAPDPLRQWKQVRETRAERMKPVLWLAVAVTLAWFAGALRYVRRAWIGLGLSQVWPAVLLPLTCYYYSFLLLTAPLTRARRSLELPFLALAAASHFVWSAFWWNDDRYAALSVLALAFTFVVLAAFTRGRRPARERVRGTSPSTAAPVLPTPVPGG